MANYFHEAMKGFHSPAAEDLHDDRREYCTADDQERTKRARLRRAAAATKRAAAIEHVPPAADELASYLDAVGQQWSDQPEISTPMGPRPNPHYELDD